MKDNITYCLFAKTCQPAGKLTTVGYKTAIKLLLLRKHLTSEPREVVLNMVAINFGAES